MSQLKVRQPEVRPPKRAKILVSGGPGVGKSWFAANFKNSVFLDIEGGAQRSQYQELLKKSESMYAGREEGIVSFNDVIEEIKILATTEHSYKSIIIDSISQLYNDAASDAETKVGNQFGANIKEANKPSRQLLRWIDKLDMNVILIAHTKSDWKSKDAQGNIGTTFDGFEKTAYHLDLWLEIAKKNFIVRKSRIPAFNEGYIFPREYKNFEELFGQDIIERNVETITLASEEDIDLVNKFLTKLNYSQAQVQKIFKQVDVEEFSEMTQTQIQSLTKYLANIVDAQQDKGK